MGHLLLLLGLLQLGEPRAAPRALLLGSGLLLAGAAQLTAEGSALHAWLSALSWPVLIAALFFSWRDGSLERTFRCRRRAKHPRPEIERS